VSEGFAVKILLSAFSCEPGRGSEPGKSWNWAYELASAGNEVWALTSSIGKPAIEAFLTSTPVPGLKFVYIERPHFPAFTEPFRALLQHIRWQWHALDVARGLDKQIDFDVIHHISFGSIHLGSQLWRLGKPFVFGPVGGGQVAPRGFRRYFRGGWIAELLRSVVVRYLTGAVLAARSTISNADLVLVANQETREWADRLGGQHVVYMSSGGIPRSLLAKPSERCRADPSCLKILWAGRLLPRKGLLLALEALARVDPSLKVHCTILGAGEQGRYLREWIETLGLADRINWRGQVPWHDAIEAYRNHDVFLFTSLRETEGVQLLEAMAGGAAIVTLDHHGPHMAVPNSAGIKVPVTTARETVAALAHALERLARDSDTVEAMSLAGMKWAAENTWDRKVAQAIAYYPTVVGETAPRPMRHKIHSSS
jgi:glycosyltransferase involved in cell wall biosynthesis